MTATATRPPSRLHLQALGEPPGLLADIGGALTPYAHALQRSGWIIHMTGMNQVRIREAACHGVRTAMRAPAATLPLSSARYDAAYLTLPSGAEGAARALKEVVRICRPRSGVVISADPHEDIEFTLSAALRAGLTRPCLYDAEGSPVGQAEAPVGARLTVTAWRP